MSRSELRARVEALETALNAERAARCAAEEVAAELRREVAALQRLVHMSKDARVAYAERQRRRAHGGRVLTKLRRQLQAKFHPDKHRRFESVASALTAVSQELNSILDSER